MDRTMESPIIAQLPRGHRMDRQFGVIYDRAPEKADDLTQIDGVRTREAVLLNQLGIYFIAQIALWRHREIIGIAGELQIPVARIVDEGWADQAKSLCRPTVAATSSGLPSSVFRTMSLLVLALFIGFFAVYLLGRHRNEALTGVLAADITSIRVPAPSRLTDINVRPGDEVFSGQPLLTLEKLEHLEMIESQERLVRDLTREVKRVEAQAAIEIEWRTRDLDRELSDLRTEVAQRESLVKGRGLMLNAATTRNGTPVSPVSSRNALAAAAATGRPRSGGILFFSGASGQFASDSTISAPAVASTATSPTMSSPTTSELQPVPVRTAMAPSEGVVSDSAMLTSADPAVEALRTELTRLESVRSTLSSTVSEALGVTTLKAHCAEAEQRLETMKSVSREVLVEAPVYGVVGQVRYRKGDDLPAGEIMLRILHTDRRYIVVHLPTRRVHEMQPGVEVELVFPGQERFRGQVVDIPMMADATDQSGATLTDVRIEPIGRLWPMVPVGSQIDVISLK